MTKILSLIFALQAQPVLVPLAELVSQQVWMLQSYRNMHKVEPSFTFCNNFFQLSTPKFVARQIVIIIRATARSTSNATMLRDKLNKNVARITPGGGGGSLPYMAYIGMCCWIGYGF